MPTDPAPGGVAAIMLGEARARGRTPLLGAAFAAAAAVHACLALGAVDRVAPAAAPPAHQVLLVEHVVELDPPVARAAPPRAATHVARSVPREAPRSLEPPASAQAGAVVAAEETAAQPVEFDEIVAGNGPGYAGGVTAANGTSAKAVPTAPVGAGEPGGTGGASRARAVGAPSRDWSCPWPAEAEGLAVDEEIVVLRVSVREDGVVSDVEVVADPGHGFGRVARACARAYRFPPALDEAGRPVSAVSPPIRVTFTRP